MGRTPVMATCSVCSTPVPLASLFTPCGSTKVVCSKCTVAREPAAPAQHRETVHSVTSRLRGTSCAVRVTDIVSSPDAAGELRLLIDSGAVRVVDAGTFVVPDHFHPAFQHRRR